MAVSSPLAGGTVTFVVTPSETTQAELLAGIADNTLTCTGTAAQAATVNFVQACELNGGATYQVYGILSYDGQYTLVDPQPITIGGKLLVTSSSFFGFVCF